MDLIGTIKRNTESLNLHVSGSGQKLPLPPEVERFSEFNLSSVYSRLYKNHSKWLNEALSEFQRMIKNILRQ